MKKVLIIEDCETDLELIKTAMRGVDCAFVEARSVAEALPLLDDEALDLIVLDLILPNGHGKEIVERVKRTRDDVPIVIVTGNPKDAPRQDFPVSSVIEKPVDFARFRASVAAAAETAEDIRSLRESSRRLGSMFRDH